MFTATQLTAPCSTARILVTRRYSPPRAVHHNQQLLPPISPRLGSIELAEEGPLDAIPL